MRKIQWHNVTVGGFLIINRILILKMSIFGATDNIFFFFLNLFFIPMVVFLFSDYLVLSVMRIDWKKYIPSFQLDLQGACMQHAETPQSETPTIGMIKFSMMHVLHCSCHAISKIFILMSFYYE